MESGVLIWLNPSFSRVIEKILTKLFSISPISYSPGQVLFPETDRGKTPYMHASATVGRRRHKRRRFPWKTIKKLCAVEETASRFQLPF